RVLLVLQTHIKPSRPLRPTCAISRTRRRLQSARLITLGHALLLLSQSAQISSNLAAALWARARPQRLHHRPPQHIITILGHTLPHKHSAYTALYRDSNSNTPLTAR